MPHSESNKSDAGRAWFFLVRKRLFAALALACLLSVINNGLNCPTATTLLQGALILAAAGCWIGLQFLHERKGLEHRKKGIWSGFLQMGTAYLAATSYAWVMYSRYATRSPGDALGSSSKDFILMAGLVGGILALFRSSGTGAAVQATLDRSEALERKLESLERGVSGVEVGLEAQFAKSPEQIGTLANRMMKLIVPLREAPRMNAVTLWIRDDREHMWRILGGFGVSAATTQNFRQRVLAGQEEGAGFVANLAAVEGDHDRLLMVRRKPNAHRWYAVDPGSEHPHGSGSFAGVLLLDRTQRPFGALCLTSQEDEAFPDDSDAEAFSRFKNGLYLWAASFTLLVERYFEIDRAEATDEQSESDDQLGPHQ